MRKPPRVKHFAGAPESFNSADKRGDGKGSDAEEERSDGNPPKADDPGVPMLIIMLTNEDTEKTEKVTVTDGQISLAFLSA